MINKILLLAILLPAMAFGIDKKTPTGTVVKDKIGKVQENFIKIPTVTRLTSGSGTYKTPLGTKYLKIRMIGGGGGGGSATGGGESWDGTSGGNTTFGGTLLVAGGGSGGVGGACCAYSGPGGSNSYTSGPIIVADIIGGRGQNYIHNAGTQSRQPGGIGGIGVFGGNGVSAQGPAGSAVAPVANSGCGGSGGPTLNSSLYAGSGGSGVIIIEEY
jgi:hypothetical protein